MLRMLVSKYISTYFKNVAEIMQVTFETVETKRRGRIFEESR